MPQPGKPWLATREEVARGKANAYAEMSRRLDTDPTYSLGANADRWQRDAAGDITGYDAGLPWWEDLLTGSAYGLTGLGVASGLLGAAGVGAATGSAATGAGGGLPVVTGLPAGTLGTTVPIAGVGAAGSGAGAAAATGASFAGKAKDWLQLAGIASSLFGDWGESDEEKLQKDALRSANELQRMQIQRLRATDPLYQAILRMAMGLMPVSARAAYRSPGTAGAVSRGTSWR